MRVTAHAPSTAAAYSVLGSSRRNRRLKRLEPRFHLSATRPASKEGTDNAVASPHSRGGCTKEPMSASPNSGSMEKFGARANLRNTPGTWYPTGKNRGRGASSCRFDRRFSFFLFCGPCNTGDQPFPAKKEHLFNRGTWEKRKQEREIHKACEGIFYTGR